MKAKLKDRVAHCVKGQEAPESPGWAMSLWTLTEAVLCQHLKPDRNISKILLSSENSWICNWAVNPRFVYPSLISFPQVWRSKHHKRHLVLGPAESIFRASKVSREFLQIYMKTTIFMTIILLSLSTHLLWTLMSNGPRDSASCVFHSATSSSLLNHN